VTELIDHDAWEIAAAVRSGEASAVEVAEASLERVAGDTLGAVWLVTEERALREARAVDAARAAGRDPGPLAGVPVGWKDLIDTGGIRTTYGSAVYADHVPERDADVVARHTAAGAVSVAKLATHEFAWGTTTQNPHFGGTRNPHDPTRVPGGSSGGSGAAVASGLVPLAPGTDTGGSIRCPASCCGIVGLKPTFGRVSLAGIHPLCFSLDHCGPMARSVRDCATSLEVIAGASVRDARTPAVPVERYRDALGHGVKGTVVALAERFFFERTQPDVAAVVRDAVAMLQDGGATLTEIDMGWPCPGPDRFSFYDSEQMAALADIWPQKRDQLGPDVVRDLTAAESMTGAEAAGWAWAMVQYQTSMLEQTERAGIDVIVTPTQAFTPPKIGTKSVDFGGIDTEVTIAMCGLTDVFNALGWPAITLPCGTDDAGMPVGIQIAALPWREADCLSVAAFLESALR
jgi:aspartyl-tRNA(Asn)/glutamyl-tRNA(Gln) amidotransferase subunit A